MALICLYSCNFQMYGYLDMTLYILISDRYEHFGGAWYIHPVPSRWTQQVIPEHYYLSVKICGVISWLTIISTTMRMSHLT